jgi:tetratricopeptide (TPR) repeat protein
MSRLRTGIAGAVVALLASGPAHAQLYLNETEGRFVGGSAIETFRVDENDPRSLGLFEPLGNLLLIPDCLAEARRAFVRQQWKKASVYYTLAETYGVEGTAVKQQLARCLYENGRTDAALERMRALTAQHPGSGDIWYNFGYLLINVKRHAEALEAFQEATRLSPGIPEYQFALACALAADGQLDASFALLKPLRKNHPRQFPLWMEGDSHYLLVIRADPRYQTLNR